MRPLSIALFLVALGCARAQPAPDDRAPLDAQGRAMLDPIRVEALGPEELVAQLELTPSSRVADIGAGPGFLTTYLARAVSSGEVIATDVRADYLAAAEARARAVGLTNVRPRIVPSDRPGLDDRSIDVAVLCQVDHALSDRAGYLAAVARTLLSSDTTFDPSGDSTSDPLWQPG